MTSLEFRQLTEKQRKNFDRIIRSVFGLTKKQMLVFNQIRECANRETCVVNLVQMMNSERSIIQKYLKVLMKKQLIFRRSVTLNEFTERCRLNQREDIAPSTSKGYLYLYTPLPDEKIVERMREITTDWIQKMDKYLEIDLS